MIFTLWTEWHDREGWEPFIFVHERGAEPFPDLDLALSVGRGLLEDEPELETVEVRVNNTAVRRLRRAGTLGVVVVTPAGAEYLLTGRR